MNVSHRAAALLVAALTFAGYGNAQTTPPPAPYLETFEVTLHNVDVIVTDQAGKIVHGLRKEDFLVSENGVPQPVTNFSLFGEAAAPGTTTGAAGGAAAAEEAPQRAPKRFIFFIDEMTLHPQTRRKLIASATKLVRSSMKPGDEAMILTPASADRIALNFTSDPEAIVAKLESVIAAQAASLRTTAQISREQYYLDTFLRRADNAAERRQVMRTYSRMSNGRVEQRLGQLRSIVGALAELPGRKAVVLITESLSATPGYEAFANDPSAIGTTALDSVQSTLALAGPSNPDWYDQRPAIAEIARTASTNGVTIYGLQPEVGSALAAPGSTETRRGNRTMLNQTFLSDTMTATEMTLSTLSDLTGGTWYRGDGPITAAFEQVGSDLSTYYSLGYPAPAGSADVARKVAVSIKGRPELRVRFRKEVVKKSLSREMTDQVVASLLVPRSSNELGITAVASEPKNEDNSRLVTVDVRVPMDKLQFLAAEAGYRAVFTVHYAAVGETAEFIAGESREQVVSIKAADLPKIAGKNWKYTTDLRIPIGPMRIAIGVMDPVSRLSGFQTLDIAAGKKNR